MKLYKHDFKRSSIFTYFYQGYLRRSSAWTGSSFTCSTLAARGTSAGSGSNVLMMSRPSSSWRRRAHITWYSERTKHRTGIHQYFQKNFQPFFFTFLHKKGTVIVFLRDPVMDRNLLKSKTFKRLCKIVAFNYSLSTEKSSKLR